MSKKITIPSCRDPFVVIMNGKRYEYKSGEEIEVDDAIAEVIETHVDSKPKAEPIPGGDSAEGDTESGGSVSNSNAYDFIITSQEQFLAEKANFYDKKILIKDVKFNLTNMDFNHAAYVEFCNVAVGCESTYVVIKNFEIGNLIGMQFGWSAEDGSQSYNCDTLCISNFSFVENLIPGGGEVHGSGLCIEYENGYGIMNCAISAATNCCNIINCHVIGRSGATFTNCTTITNLHAKGFYYGYSVTFDNCTHLSNLAFPEAGSITYNSCSKVCYDTCDGYNG